VLEALAARLFAERAGNSSVGDLEEAFRDFEKACEIRDLSVTRRPSPEIKNP